MASASAVAGGEVGGSGAGLEVPVAEEGSRLRELGVNMKGDQWIKYCCNMYNEYVTCIYTYIIIV